MVLPELYFRGAFSWEDTPTDQGHAGARITGTPGSLTGLTRCKKDVAPSDYMDKCTASPSVKSIFERT